MKKYNGLTMEVVELNAKDALTTSGNKKKFMVICNDGTVHYAPNENAARNICTDHSGCSKIHDNKDWLDK